VNLPISDFGMRISDLDILEFGFELLRRRYVDEALMKENDEIISIIIASIKTARQSKQ